MRDARSPGASIRLFHTLQHDCGYFADRQARNLVIDPVDPKLPSLYEQALFAGFRRAGAHVYRPHCQGCQACVPARVPVHRFEPNRSQRRIWQRNADLAVDFEAAEYGDEALDLYQRYLRHRHPGGGMDGAERQDFERFLLGRWSDTRFLCFRLEGRLLALAVCDLTDNALSAVYTCFDPTQARRSLGTYAILRQIDAARRSGLAYVFLGYWIAGHPKMHYKASFRPLQLLRDGNWLDASPLTRDAPGRPPEH